MLKKLPIKAENSVPIFLGFNTLAGLILFTAFVLPRSEPASQFLFGLSLARFLIAAFFLLLLLISLAATLLVTLQRQENLRKKLTAFFTRYQNEALIFSYALFISTSAFLLLTIPPIIRPLAFLAPFSARLSSLIGWFFISSLVFIILLRVTLPKEEKTIALLKKLDHLLTLYGIFIITFFLYVRYTFLIGWVGKTKYSFFDILAEAFVQGRLYIKNPPYVHDLTPYQGRWYVPMPPLPAILLMPLAYFVGAAGISTSYISIMVSALNGVLLYEIFQELKKRGWLALSENAIFLLLALFLFGTSHFWLGFSGRGWFFAQILTVFFLALAIYATIHALSPWWIGVFVGMAIMTRPTAMMTTPFLLAITLQIMQDKGEKLAFKSILGWILQAAVPITIAIASLLAYNYLRFDNIFDFGYVTVNAGPEVVKNVQRWGTFSLHFLPANLNVMLFKLPFWNPGGRWLILPSATGTSIFLVTPALIYLFRRYPKNWFVAGAWSAVILSAGLMLTYHNTGAHQFGYRYILDFILPLMLLLGFSLKKKIPWHFIALTILSIAVNLYGANWFMNG